jgi:DNA-binding MarR family transcriptional regulator
MTDRADTAARADHADHADRAARVWRALLALVLEKNDRRRQASDALELSYIKVKALRQLASSPLSMRDLTSTLASDAPYTTLVVDELERRGFAERRVNPTDRRSKLVSLTADGQRAAALAESIMTDPPDGFRALPVGDLGHLERIVTRLGGFD